MHDWLGVGLIALGLGLVGAGFVKRWNRIARPLPEGAIRPEFAAMGEIARPLILSVVGLFGLKMTLFYFVLGGQRYLTALDFGGLLFVLASYSGYLVMATAKRAAPVPAVVAAPDAEAAVDLRRAA